MPTISLFYGIAIRMYFYDHAPPHFHAIYGGEEAVISIETGEIVDGSLPGNARRLVREWTALNRPVLSINWGKAHAGQPLERIPGLDVE